MLFKFDTLEIDKSPSPIKFCLLSNKVFISVAVYLLSNSSFILFKNKESLSNVLAIFSRVFRLVDIFPVMLLILDCIKAVVATLSSFFVKSVIRGIVTEPVNEGLCDVAF